VAGKTLIWKAPNVNWDRILFYVSLVGGIAGLNAWALNSLITVAVGAVSEIVAAAVLGALIGAGVIAISDHFEGGIQARWVFAGAAIAGSMGALGALPHFFTAEFLFERQHTVIARTLLWMLVGGSVGLGVGLRSMQINSLRSFHAALGGLIGGVIGSVIFQIPQAGFPDLLQAVGYVIVGLGIATGIALAPVVAQSAILRFLSCENPGVSAKMRSARREWTIQEGDALSLGSQDQSAAETRFMRTVDMFVPDPKIAPQHALFWARNQRYYLQAHESIATGAKRSRYTLQAGGHTVSGAHELQDGDEIVAGKSVFVFNNRAR